MKMDLDSSSVTVRTHLSIDDWRAYQRAFRTRSYRARGWKTGFVPAALLGFVLMVLLQIAVADVKQRALIAYGLFAGIGLTYLGILIFSRLVARRIVPDKDGVFLGEFEMNFSSEAIRVTGCRADTSYRWAGVNDITFDAQHIFIWVDRLGALIVPVRDLPGSLTAAGAVDQFRGWATSLTSSASIPAAMPDIAADRAPNTANGLGRPGTTLRALWKLYTAQRVDGAALHASDRTILAIGLATVALWISAGRLEAGPRAQFAWWSLGELGWYFLIPLVFAWISARMSSPRVPIRQALTLMVGLAPLAVATDLLNGLHQGSSWSLMAGLIAAALAVGLLLRGLAAITGAVQHKAVALIICCSLALAVAANQLDLQPSVWYTPRDDGAAAKAAWTNGERLLFEQPAKIDAALAQIDPPADDSAAAYLVGFAGVGEQRVFAEEVSLAARLLGQRYAAEHRTLLLLNDQRDLDSRPLATVTGLKRALTGVGSRMRPDRDVLFLFLSSHGSAGASLAVSNGQLPLQQLSGEALASALKASGIRWKVIVISACYSGSFIEPLRDDNTIIITAAAADRTSFGCSNDRDLTYFGEAFFRDALPGALTLQEAFERARSTIADRERTEKITPSNPQAFFGPAMAAKLQELESLRGSTNSSRMVGPT